MCGSVIPFKGIAQQTLSASTSIICQGDSTLLEATTSLIFSGWENLYGTPINVADPKQLSIWVKPSITTDYVATAKKILPVNLVPNGDFEAGNTGFTSSYAYANNVVTGGFYSVDKNPNRHLPAYVARGDHSTGTGNFLLMDGGRDTTQFIYKTEVMVDSATEYYVSAWMANTHKSFAAPNPDTSFWTTGHFVIEIDGESISTLRLPYDTSWNRVGGMWRAGRSAVVVLTIRSLENGIQGNDCVIDDIAMQEIQKIKFTVKNVLSCNLLTVFSPNGDGAYDTYFISDQGWAKVFDLQGNLVSQFKAPAHWNGNHSDGREANSGYYAIVIDNQMIKHVSLVR